MILLSFVELLQEGIRTNGTFAGILFFLLGMGVMLLIDMGLSHRYEYEDGIHAKENNHLPDKGLNNRHRHQ